MQEDQQQVVFKNIKSEIEGQLKFEFNFREILDRNLAKKIYNPKDAQLWCSKISEECL